MAFTTGPTLEVIAGQQAVYDQVVSAFSIHGSVGQFLVTLNAFFNALIGLSITVGIAAVFVHLICWIISKKDANRNLAIKGATRGMIAVFLMVNIWSIFRLVLAVVDFSNITAFWVYVAAVILFAFWGLFSLGDGFIRLLSIVLDYVLDLSITYVRRMGARSESSVARWLRSAGQVKLRLIALGVLALLITPLSFADFSAPKDSQWRPLFGTENRLLLTFPPEWVVTVEGQTSPVLLTALYASSTATLYGYYYDGPLTIEGFVPSDQFSDLTNSVAKKYTDAGWALQYFSIDDPIQVGDADGYQINIGVADPRNSLSGISERNLLFGKGRRYYILNLATAIDGIDSAADRAKLDRAVEDLQHVFNSLVFYP